MCGGARHTFHRLPMTSLVLLVFCQRGWTWTKTLRPPARKEDVSQKRNRGKNSAASTQLRCANPNFPQRAQRRKTRPLLQPRVGGRESEQTHISRSPFLPALSTRQAFPSGERLTHIYWVCNLLCRSGEPVAELKQMRSDVYFGAHGEPTPCVCPPPVCTSTYI
jgi:hypothetical protein